jgi:biotin--protein ligase
VENGGRLLAFSIGVRGLRGDLITTLEDLAISNEGSLRLCDTAGNGDIALDFNYWNDKDSISFDLECGGTRIQGVPCHSPRPPLLNLDTKRDASVLGRFPDDTIAGIKYPLGSGNVVIWAVHLETTLTGDAEEQRLTVLRRSLQECGLHIATHSTRKTPLPQFLVGKSSIIKRIIEDIWADPSNEEVFIVQDGNDTFHFHSSKKSSSLLQECRDKDLPSWKPRRIIIHVDGTFPLKDQTPLFDIEQYFKHLSNAREKRNTNDGWGIGEALLYGELVTSTQTMLEKWVFLPLSNTSDLLHA